MKQKLEQVVGFAIDFIGTGSFFYCFFYIVLGILHRMKLISIATQSKISLILAVAFAIAFCGYSIYRTKAKRKTKFDNWLSMNYPRLLLHCVVALICFGSIDNEVKFSISDLKDIVSLEWTILGVTMAIFFVWNAFIVDYLEKRKPVQSNDASPASRIKYISDKSAFFQKASMTFNLVTLLTIEVFLLVAATVLAYMFTGEPTRFAQDITIISFYFSTNVILQLFLEIIKPIKEAKHSLLKDTYVSNTEVEEQNQILDKRERFLQTMKGIKSSTAFADEKKEDIIAALLHECLGVADAKPVSDDKGNDKKDTQQQNHDS